MYRKTLLQILLLSDEIWIQWFTGGPKPIVVQIVSDVFMSPDHLRRFEAVKNRTNPSPSRASVIVRTEDARAAAAVAAARMVSAGIEAGISTVPRAVQIHL